MQTQIGLQIHWIENRTPNWNRNRNRFLFQRGAPIAWATRKQTSVALKQNISPWQRIIRNCFEFWSTQLPLEMTTKIVSSSWNNIRFINARSTWTPDYISSRTSTKMGNYSFLHPNKRDGGWHPEQASRTCQSGVLPEHTKGVVALHSVPCAALAHLGAPIEISSSSTIDFSL